MKLFCLACESTDELVKQASLSTLWFLGFKQGVGSRHASRNEDIEAVCLVRDGLLPPLIPCSFGCSLSAVFRKRSSVFPGLWCQWQDMGRQLFIVYHRGTGFD
uniref:Uncharacterized protein n=1 Tax=Ixodes ricinus TaxID=34613 RepID=A0A0K8R4X7_IXORI